MIKALWAVSFFYFFSNQLFGQFRAFLLYPTDSIPLSKSCSIIEKQDTTKEGRVNRVSKITQPRLWFFPASKSYFQNQRSALVVFPGGAYSFVSAENEGRKVGEAFSKLGFDVFIVLYRLPLSDCQSDPKWVPLTDGMAAVDLVQNKGYAKTYLMGFSAGGHLASSLSTLSELNPYHKPIRMPDAVCLIYPVIDFSKFKHTGSRRNLLAGDTNSKFESTFSTHLQINKKTPPTILIHSLDDKAVPWQNSLLYMEALTKFDGISEVHFFPFGGHGYGLGPIERLNSPDWVSMAVNFFKKH